jgi:recombination protein RecR
MNSIDKLSEIFSKFPGIGPRQAKRFVYFLLTRNSDYTSELIRAVESLKREISQCDTCLRYYAKNGGNTKTCSVCSDESRDATLLMLVPRDIDMESVEKSKGYNGHYFVLGGVVPILEKEPEKKIRIKNLESRIKKDSNIKEVILAMNANLEGENTAEFIKSYFKDSNLVFSTLGRGLSTGAELEYADPETLKSALIHRTS